MRSDSGDSEDGRPPLDLPPEAPEGAGAALVKNTPWWSVSTGMHVLAALALAWFWAVDLKGEEEVLVATVVRKPRPQIEFEKPKDLPEKPKILDDKSVAQEVVFNNQADPDDKVRTDDDEPWDTAKGDSEDFVSNKPFKGRATYDVVGGGGGGGGRFGTRRGSNKYTTCRGGGGGTDTEDAVLAALRWLARHQNPDGSWSVQGYTARCKESCTPNPGQADFDAGVSGLSLLAFLGAGYSHLSKDTFDGICFGDVVRKGLQGLLANQDPEGCIGPRSAHKYMYNHTICALAVTEAYGLTGSTLFKDQAQKAVDFTVASQNPGKGWRYSYKCGDNDSSVTGWAAMVLKSAELSGLAFPKTSYDGARAWYDEATEASYSRVGYDRPGTGKVYVVGQNEQFDHNEALTSIGVMTRIFIDKDRRDPRVSNGIDLLLRNKPQWSGNAIDFYYWYYASLAIFQTDGAKGAKWRSWNEPMKDALLNNQNPKTAGCRRGSWEPVDRWSCEGGRVYATAINALTLEVYYRYANVFGLK